MTQPKGLLVTSQRLGMILGHGLNHLVPKMFMDFSCCFFFPSCFVLDLSNFQKQQQGPMKTRLKDEHPDTGTSQKTTDEWERYTLQGTNISPKNGILKMIFLFPRWDMLIPWRVEGLHAFAGSFPRIILRF